ncbi:septation protein IspZ, partial [Escherichia coli]|uniref:septation protein IspZ n=1 Tax=Escherichia coli TaxID=562 RepID=UPI001485B1BD
FFFSFFRSFVGGSLAVCFCFVLWWSLFWCVKRIALFPLFLWVIFGGFSLFFPNVEFINWKFTVIYARFVGARLVCQWGMKKPLIRRMLGKELTLPQSVWS